MMSAMLFCKHCCHVCCTFGAGRNGKNGLLSQKCPQAGSVCKQENTFLLVAKGTTPTNQKIMAKHVIWLLRNRGNCGRDRGRRVTAAMTVTETQINIEFWELRDLHIACLECVDSVLCSIWCGALVCGGVIFWFCESKQWGDCWMWSKQCLSLRHC